jgi:hypothetical protein
MSRRRHEVRDRHGRLVAVVEVIDLALGTLTHGASKSAEPRTVELAVDAGGSSYRVTIFDPAIGEAPKGIGVTHIPSPKGIRMTRTPSAKRRPVVAQRELWPIAV